MKVKTEMSKFEAALIALLKNPSAASFSGVVVVDGVCGIGKTTSMKEHIYRSVLPAHDENRVLYVVPTILELHRVAGTEGKKKKSKDPELNGKLLSDPIRNKKGEIIYKDPISKSIGFEHTVSTNLRGVKRDKLKHLKQLLSGNKNVVITHVLFEILDKECIDLIKDKRYHLIIDEEPNVIQSIKDRYKFKYTYGKSVGLHDSELSKLVKLGALNIAGESVVLTPLAEGLKRYSDIFHDVNEGRIKVYNTGSNTKFLWSQNPELFKVFKSTHVLTYQFRGTYLEGYFQVNKIPYIVENRTWMEILNEGKVNPFHNLITALTLKQSVFSTEIDGIPLSSSWFDDYIKFVENGGKNILKTALKKYFNNGTKEEEKLWTTYKKVEYLLTAPGYKKTFIPVTTKATNKFIDRSHLAFVANIFPHPIILNYFAKHKFKVDRDVYSSSVLLQWMFRSRLREGKNITILLPSLDMFVLLQQWMSNFKNQYNSVRNFINDYPNIGNSEFQPEPVDFELDEFLNQHPGAAHIQWLNQFASNI
jgi:hypothetical protein